MMNHRFLSVGSLSCVCLLSAGARAQWGGLTDASGPLNTQSFSFGGTNPLAGTTNENYYDGDLGDVAGDGLADRMLGSRYGLLVNQGGGLMKVARTYLGFLLRGDPGASGWGEDAAQFADLDDDGDLDALMGGNGEPLSAQRNAEGPALRGCTPRAIAPRSTSSTRTSSAMATSIWSSRTPSARTARAAAP